MKRGPKIAIAVVGVFAAMQIGQCERANPPVTSELETPPDVKAVLRRACYDCHSNETKWRWYGYVAPASWLLHRDVYDGRKHLNFSEWDKVPIERRAKKLGNVTKQVASGDMPPWFYLPLHSEAKLTDADKKVLEDWAKGAASAAPSSSAPPVLR